MIFQSLYLSLITLSVFVSIFSYTRIFFKLRHQQSQVQGVHQGQPNGEGIPLNIARYRKTVSSIAHVQLALVVCYGSVYYLYCFNNVTGWSYPASRGPSIFLDKSGRGRDLCQPPRLSLICRSSTETDESVQFETSFSRSCSVRMCLVRNC